MKRSMAKKLHLTTKAKQKEQAAVHDTEAVTYSTMTDEIESQSVLLRTPHSLDMLTNGLVRNPFEILEESATAPEGHLISKRTTIERKEIGDDPILQNLRRVRTIQDTSSNKRRQGIFNQINVITKQELCTESKKYYKFPIEIAVLNDGSQISNRICNGFISAMSSVYANYRRFGEPFKVLLAGDLYEFGNSVRCTSNKILVENEIAFTETDNSVVVVPDDVGLLHDVLINTEILEGAVIPFILSETEFDNGTVFRTKVVRGPTVKSSDGRLFSYRINGPVDSSVLQLPPGSIVEYD